MSHQQPPQQRGFSLIELLIVVATLGIISAIAVPSLLGARGGAAGVGNRDLASLGLRPGELQHPSTGGATVTGATGRNSTGVFSLDFGNVNGLGIGTPSTGVTVDVQAGGTLYTSPVTLTPRFSGFNTSTASVSILLDGTAGNASGRTATREGASATTVVAPNATVPNIFTTSAANNTAITRYVGVFVGNGNGVSAVSGALTSRLIYQITAP